MVELLAMIMGLVLCFCLPYGAIKARRGQIGKNFKGDARAFRAATRKQMMMLMWVAIVIGAANVALAPISLEPGEWVFKLIGAAIWFTAAAVAYYSRGMLAEQPA